MSFVSDTKPRNQVDHVMEEGIPPPNRYAGFGRPRTYPWPQLEVGKSVFFPKRNTKAISTSLYNWRKMNPAHEYIVRTVNEDGVKGVRVWRNA